MALDKYINPVIFQTQSNGQTNFKDLQSGYHTFWSGMDAAIYFHDIYIGQVVQIGWQMDERTMPIYSYADYTYSKSIKGARIVQGSFTINFQQAQLFNLLMTYLRNVLLDQTNPNPSQSPVTTSKTSSISQRFSANQPDLALTTLTQLSPDVASQLVSTQEYQNYLQDRSTSTKKKLVQSVKSNTQSLLSNASAAQQTMAKTNQFWFTDQATSIDMTGTAAGSLLSQAKQSLTPFYSRFDLETGFQISAVFGDPNISGSNTKVFDLQSPYGFANLAVSHKEMVDKIQAKDFYAAADAGPLYTTIQIVGVDITGYGQMVDDSGRPLLQTYNFIARDIL